MIVEDNTRGESYVIEIASHEANRPHTFKYSFQYGWDFVYLHFLEYRSIRRHASFVTNLAQTQGLSFFLSVFSNSLCFALTWFVEPPFVIDVVSGFVGGCLV